MAFSIKSDRTNQFLSNTLRQQFIVCISVIVELKKMFYNNLVYGD